MATPLAAVFNQRRGVCQDFSHLMIACLLSLDSPRYGFVDLDPTNNILVGNQHITLAIGRDFGDVTPLRGVVFGGGRHDLKVEVDVASDD